jgi:ParB-like chromosome segregation protein Spo0J
MPKPLPIDSAPMAARSTKLPTTADGLPAAADLPVRDLHLDPHNPRLAGLDLSVDQQDEITRVLWQDRAVNELVDSIATNGYWRHEELFASRETGKLIVIEGNRRLAAVKLLTDDGLRNRLGITGLPTLRAPEKAKLQTLPVIECDRQDVWQYIGFKHVTNQSLV